jgi:two-component system cell cycle response regulator CtrA
MRILLVEGDPTLSRSLERTISRAGTTPCTTASGEDTTDLAKLYDYDLIVWDLSLPDELAPHSTGHSEPALAAWACA